MDTKIIKILVNGAGVIGSVYTSALIKAGIDITLLVRSKRIKDIRDNGIGRRVYSAFTTIINSNTCLGNIDRVHP